MINKVKIQHTDWEKIFMIHITGKRLKLRIYKLCLQISKEGRKEERDKSKERK